MDGLKHTLSGADVRGTLKQNPPFFQIIELGKKIQENQDCLKIKLMFHKVPSCSLPFSCRTKH